MACALCLLDRELRESHIFPKFTYRRMRQSDDQRRFLHFSTTGENPEGTVIQDGFKERLLCQECEGHISRYEDYFARILNQKQLFDLEIPEGRKWVRIDGLEYARTKLFLLSVLWRAEVASDLRFNIQLGERHRERLRTMLLADDPGPPAEYGCVVAVPYINVEGQEPIVRAPMSITPENVRWEHGLRIVRMQVDGLLLQFIVGALELCERQPVRALFLQLDGTMVVGVEDLMRIWYLRDSSGRSLGHL